MPLKTEHDEAITSVKTTRNSLLTANPLIRVIAL